MKSCDMWLSEGSTDLKRGTNSTIEFRSSGWSLNLIVSWRHVITQLGVTPQLNPTAIHFIFYRYNWIFQIILKTFFRVGYDSQFLNQNSLFGFSENDVGICCWYSVFDGLLGEILKISGLPLPCHNLTFWETLDFLFIFQQCSAKAIFVPCFDGELSLGALGVTALQLWALVPVDKFKERTGGNIVKSHFLCIACLIQNRLSAK